MAISPLKLPKLLENVPLIAEGGKPTITFTLWWLKVISQIQTSVNGVIDALNAAAAAQATADAALAAADQPKFSQLMVIGNGTYVIQNVLVAAGTIMNAEAKLGFGPVVSGGVLTFDLQYSVAGAGVWTTLDTNTQGYAVPDTVYVELAGNMTNPGGTDQLYDFRSVAATTSGPIDTSRSFLRVYN